MENVDHAMPNLKPNAEVVTTVIKKLKADVQTGTTKSEPTIDTAVLSPPPAPSTGISPPETAIVPDWAQSLPDELKNHGSLTKFKDLPALVQSYLEAQKSLSKRFAMPDEEASVEEWGQFYNKLGRPEDKKYLEASERGKEDQELLDKYETVLYESGISKRQGAQLLRHFGDLTTEMESKTSKNLQAQKDKHLEILQKTYGDTFDQKIPLMQAAMQKMGSKELADLVEQTQYHPGLMQLLVAFGETLKSDFLVSGTTTPRTIGKEAALAEIQRLQSDNAFMLQYTQDGLGHEAAVSKMMELHQMAYAK